MVVPKKAKKFGGSSAHQKSIMRNLAIYQMLVWPLLILSRLSLRTLNGMFYLNDLRSFWDPGDHFPMISLKVFLGLKKTIIK